MTRQEAQLLSSLVGDGPDSATGRWMTAVPAFLTALVSVLLVASSVAVAGDGPAVENVSVVVNKSRILRMPVPIKRASVGNPEIADLLVVGRSDVYLLGKKLGSTNVTVWDSKGRLVKAMDVEVVHDLVTLKRKLHELLPGQEVKIFSSQGDLVVAGEVSSAQKLDAALAVAGSFLPRDEEGKPVGAVHNMAQVGGSQQVMLEIKVAEVARSLTRRLGIDWNMFAPGSPWSIGAVNGGAGFRDAVLDVPRIDPLSGAFDGFVERRVPIFAGGGLRGPFIQEFNPASLAVSDNGIFGSFLTGSLVFNFVVDAAKDSSLAKVLAEPTLTAVSGNEAKFIAGGEFPIPVAQDLGQVTIEFKEFGIGVRFLPVVLDSEVISLQVNVDVSELSSIAALVVDVPTTTQAFSVPSLTKRAATTSVEVRSGNTIGIAGLISDRVRESVDKFPGLGEVPMLGTLFRSQDFLSEATELVIFVTPRLAQSIKPSEVRLPTDAFVEPSDAEFYLMGKLEGERPADDSRPVGSGGSEGRFGHVQ